MPNILSSILNAAGKPSSCLAWTKSFLSCDQAAFFIFVKVMMMMMMAFILKR